MEPLAFISYSSKDFELASRIVTELEDSGILCWIAPRNIPYGTTYQASIIRGIKNATMMIFIFTKSSNESDAVIKEIEKADSLKLPIIPYRADDVEYSDALDYHLSTRQAINAFKFADPGTAIQQLISQLKISKQVHAKTPGPEIKKTETLVSKKNPAPPAKSSISFTIESLLAFEEVYVRKWNQKNSAETIINGNGLLVFTDHYMKLEHAKLHIQTDKIIRVQFQPEKPGQFLYNYIIIEFETGNNNKADKIIVNLYGVEGMTMQMMDRIAALHKSGKLKYIKEVSYNIAATGTVAKDAMLIEFTDIVVVRPENRNKNIRWLGAGKLKVFSEYLQYETFTVYVKNNLPEKKEELRQIIITGIQRILFRKQDNNHLNNYLEVEFIKDNKTETLLFFRETFWGGGTKEMYNTIARLNIQGRLDFISNMQIEI